MFRAFQRFTSKGNVLSSAASVFNFSISGEVVRLSEKILGHAPVGKASLESFLKNAGLDV